MFSDEKWMSAAQKDAVLRDWHHFIRNGFRYEDFTEALYHHLIRHASFIAHYDRRTFWLTYFEHDFGHFARFINQVGGDLRSAELGLPDWADSHTGADLNRALISEMRLFFKTFIAILNEAASAAYNAEKWSELRELHPDGDSQRLNHLAIIYDDLYPLHDYAQYVPVTPAVRDQLRRAVQDFIAGKDAPTVFEAQSAVPPPATAQASVFDRADAVPAHAARLAADTLRTATAPQEVYDEYAEIVD